MTFLSILRKCECPLLFAAAFVMPLYATVPGFSLWKIVPRLTAVRCHLIQLDATAPWTNTALIGLVMAFWCLLLEFKRRRLDELLARASRAKEETTRRMTQDTLISHDHDEQEETVHEATDACSWPAENRSDSWNQQQLLRRTWDQLCLPQDTWDELQLLQDTWGSIEPLDPSGHFFQPQHAPIVEESFSELLITTATEG